AEGPDVHSDYGRNRRKVVGYIEVRHASVGLAERGYVFVAQPKIQAEPVGNAPVVIEKSVPAVGGKRKHAGEVLHLGALRQTQQKIRQVPARARHWRSVRDGRSGVSGEHERPLSVVAAVGVELRAAKPAAPMQGVLAVSPRQVFGRLVGTVGAQPR